MLNLNNMGYDCFVMAKAFNSTIRMQHSASVMAETDSARMTSKTLAGSLNASFAN
jgi:hypothetical protein